MAAAPASSSTVDPRVAEQVRADQVCTLYHHSAPVLLANVVNAIIVSAVLWSHAFHARARGRRACALGLRFTLGSLSAGCLWGYANEQLETRVRVRTRELQESQAFDAVSLTSAVHVALQRARGEAQASCAAD